MGIKDPIFVRHTNSHTPSRFDNKFNTKGAIFSNKDRTETIKSVNEQYPKEMSLEEIEKQSFKKLSSNTYFKRTQIGTVMYECGTDSKYRRIK